MSIFLIEDPHLSITLKHLQANVKTSGSIPDKYLSLFMHAEMLNSKPARLTMVSTLALPNESLKWKDKKIAR